MIKIVIEKGLGTALLAFRPKDYRRAINGIYSAPDGALIATDGKRLIHITKERHMVKLPEGVYDVTAKGTENMSLMWLTLERVEEQFPDYNQVLPKHDLAIKNGEKALSFAIQKNKKTRDHLALMRALYHTFHITGKAYDPLLLLDLPVNEGFHLYTDGTPSGVLDARGEGIRAIFCPFKPQD